MEEQRNERHDMEDKKMADINPMLSVIYLI